MNKLFNNCPKEDENCPHFWRGYCLIINCIKEKKNGVSENKDKSS